MRLEQISEDEFDEVTGVTVYKRYEFDIKMYKKSLMVIRIYYRNRIIYETDKEITDNEILQKIRDYREAREHYYYKVIDEDRRKT